MRPFNAEQLTKATQGTVGQLNGIENNTTIILWF